MGNAIITTQGGKALPALPAHIKGAPGANEIVKSGLSSGFQAPPELSIRGGKFRLKIDGDETLITKRDDEGNEVPRAIVPVVIVAANHGKYKAFYGTKYDPDAEPTAPKCYSYDGERPSIHAQEPQSKTCAACEKNVFGSATTEQGKKTRACSDNKLLAVIPVSAVRKKAPANELSGMAFRIKVSPTALSRNKEDRKANPQNNTSLSEYINLLDNYPVNGNTVAVPVTSVETRLFLDKDADYPLLRFKLGGFLDEDEIKYVQERAAGEDIKAIISEVVAPEGVAASKNDRDDDDEGAPPADDDDEGVPPAPGSVIKRTQGPQDDDDDGDVTVPAKHKAAAPLVDEPVPVKSRGGRPKKVKEDSEAPKVKKASDEDDPDDGVQRASPVIDKTIADIKGLFG
ncbi:MAG: hypothetical protein KGI71_06475 [Patescibacteria group bacterium]|nr:hypothetical protein [Patescibacteria group bacterium]